MSQRLRLPSIAAPVSVLLALVFSVLPRTWIESTFVVDPDGGSGVLELLFVPVAIAFAVYLFRKPARAFRVSEPPPLPHDAV